MSTGKYGHGGIPDPVNSTASGDLVLRPSSALGDLILMTGDNTERGRIAFDGTATGAFGAGGTGIANPQAVIAPVDATTTEKARADYVCDGVDDHVEINSAMTAMGTNGGQILLLPGNFSGGQVAVKNNFWIAGTGMRATSYLLKNGVNADAFINYVSADGVEGNAEFITISDLRIDGNKANQTSGRGIYLNANPAGVKATNEADFDPHNRIMNVLLENIKGDGFVSASRSETRLHNVYVNNADGNGFVPSYDMFMDACTAAGVGLRGFYIQHSSVRIVNSKAFYSGRLTPTLGNGFNIEGTFGVVIAGCEAQDNKNAGILLDTSFGCNVQMSCDSNSTRGAGSAPAVDIWAGGNHNLDIVATERKANGTTSFQLQGLRVRTASVNSNIRMQHYAQGGATVGVAIDTGSDSVAGNNIQINGAGSTVTPAFAASYTPDPYAAKNHRIGNLTAGITINAPSNSHIGAELVIVLRQDATGTRTVTWNAAFINTPTTNTAANAVTVGRFVYDGTNWVGMN